MASKKSSTARGAISHEHQLTSPYLSHAQKHVFGRAKRAEARAASTPAPRKTAKKASSRKRAAKKAAAETPVAETK
jgi:hypothetical protein